MIKLKLITLLCFVCFLKVFTQEGYPVITNIVTDEAHLLNDFQKAQLEQKLTAYETRTTHQIVVLSINSLGNDTVENYALKTFNQVGNQIGQKETDNGILILIAKYDREFRIEVGDGLTPIITDAVSSRINRNIITPAFKDGEYYKGINEATSEIIKLIDSPKYRDEFAAAAKDESSVSLTTKIISTFFLTLFFFGMGIFGYNHLIAKTKRNKIKIKELYFNNKIRFFTIWALIICIGTYLNALLWDTFLAICIIGFFSVFIYLGLFVLFKETFKRSVKIFTSLFTGKLGLLIFPFYIPFTIILFFASCIFGFMPFSIGALFAIQYIFDKNINSVMTGVSPIYILYVFLGILLLFFIITAIVAYKDVKRSFKKSFAFSFFNFDKTLIKTIGRGASRGYSSSGSSSYSSRSSSRSSFSGGGGSSSGGGSSGSW